MDDKIKKLLKKKRQTIDKQNNKQLASICQSLGSYYSENKEYEKALSNYKDEMNVRMKLNDGMDTGRAHRMIGEMNIMLNKFEEALEHVDLYLRTAKVENNKIEEQRAYTTLGRAYLVQGQSETITVSEDKMKALKNAEKAFIKGLLICNELTGTISNVEILNMQARLYLNLSVTKDCMDNSDESMAYINKAILLCRKHDFFDLLHLCYSTMGSMYLLKQKDTSKAIRVYNLALEVAERLSDCNHAKCETLFSKSEVFIQLGDFQSAKQVLHKAYKLRSPIEFERENIERNLKIVSAICYAEDSLLATDQSNYAARKKMYERMGDGSCNLQNYTKAIDYYLKMLECATKNGDSDRQMLPIYISLYQTYKDNKEYEMALKYLWKDLQCNDMIPKEAIVTLFNIAEMYELCGKDFWQSDSILQRAREHAQKIGDVELEKRVIIRQIRLRKLHGMDTMINLLKDEAALAGIYIQSWDECLDSESESNDAIEHNTPDIGDDICLDDLTDSESDNESVNQITSTTTVRKRGQTIKIKRNAKGETQLHQACISGNILLARRLLDQGHPVNIRDNAGWLPLHEACNHGYKELVTILLDHNSAIDDKGGVSCDGITPLYDACSNGQLEIVELLLDRAANPTLRTDFGQTPLDALQSWRSRAKNLDDDEESFYVVLCDRLTEKLNRAGITTISQSPGKAQLNESKEKLSGNSKKSNKKNVEEKSVQRIDRLRLFNIDDGSESENERLDGELQLITNESDADSIRSSSPSTSSTITKFININNDPTLEYQNVMDKLRTGNKLSGTSTISPPEKHIKRPGFMEKNEIDDEWLEDDLKPSRKKRKYLSDRNLISSDRLKSTKKSPVKTNTIPSIDAFDLLMNPEPIHRRRRSSLSLSKKKIERTVSSSTLLDAGFFSYTTEQPETNEADAVQQILNVSDTVANISAGSATGSSIAVPISIKVKVEDQLLNVPVTRDLVNDLTIQWLIDETARRYYNLKGLRPILQLTTEDGAIFEHTDPLNVIFGLPICGSNVLEWVLPPLAERYLEACSLYKNVPDDNIKEKFDLIQATHKLTITNQLLGPYEVRPLFKTLHYQENLTAIELSNNMIGDDGLKYLTNALPTLKNLTTLNLSGNIITATGLGYLSSSFIAEPATVPKLIELDLSFNPLKNLSASIIITILNYLSSSLRRLSLCSTGLTDFNTNDLSMSGIIDLDVSFNTLSINLISKLLQKFNSCRVERLNFGYTVTDKGLSDVIQQFFTLGTCESLQCINLSNCHLTDTDLWKLLQIVTRSKRLEKIVLMENPELGWTTMKSFLQKSGNLKTVRLEGCPHLLTNINFIEPNGTYQPAENIFLTINSTKVKSRDEQMYDLKKMWTLIHRNDGFDGDNDKAKIYVKDYLVLLTIDSKPSVDDMNVYC